MVLKHHGPVGPRAANLTVGAKQRALGRQRQARQQIQQGGLAATRVADQGHDFTLGHGEVDVVQGNEGALGGFERLLNALDFDVFGGQ